MPHDSPITFLPQGAIPHTFTIANHNILLSFPTPNSYARPTTQYIGETVGRVANRIPSGVNNRSYQLSVNRPPNHLHGGTVGWGKKIFKGPETGEGRKRSNEV
jgi:aldose 1-epimerase